MKKQQKLPLMINGDYADLILPELSFNLWNKFRIRTKVVDHSFEDDPVRQVDLLFMSTDSMAIKIESAIQSEYELYQSDGSQK